MILLSLVLLGAFNGIPATRSGPVPFSTARSTSDAFAKDHGTWTLFQAAGFDPANPATSNVFNATMYPTCNLTSFTGPVPTTVPLSGYGGNLSNGVASAWWFSYYPPSESADLMILEIDGVVSTAFEVAGSTCPYVPVGGFPGPLSRPIDSPLAVTNALQAGGSYFLESHSTGVSLSIALQYGAWFVDWTTCTFFPGPTGWMGQGFQFSVIENQTTGLVDRGQTFNGTCGGPPPIGVVLGFGTPTLSQESHPGRLDTQGCNVGDYCYTIPIAKALQYVTPGDLSIGVYQDDNGDNNVVGYAILDDQGGVVVTADGPFTGSGDTFWNPGWGMYDTALQITFNLSVDMGGFNPMGAGYELVVSGYGPNFASSPYYAIPLP